MVDLLRGQIFQPIGREDDHQRQDEGDGKDDAAEVRRSEPAEIDGAEAGWSAHL